MNLRNALLAAAFAGGISIAPTVDAAPVRLTAEGAVEIPEALWVAPVGAEADEDRWLALQRLGSHGGSYVGEYGADLGAGRYRVVAYGAMNGNWRMPLRFTAAEAERFDVADAAVDLGRIELMSSTFGLTLAHRRSGDAGWAQASAPAPVVQALRDDVRWLTVPQESADGAWSTLASGNRLAVRSGAGAWTVHRVLTGGRPQAYELVSADTAIVAGDFGRLEWQVFGQPAQQLATDGWPDGEAAFLHCDAARRCAAGVRAGVDLVLLHTSDVASAPWRTVATLAGQKCGWTCTGAPTLLRLGNEVLAFDGKSTMRRLRLDDGQASQEELPFRHAGAAASGTRVVAGDQMSADGGRTWSEVNARKARGTMHFDANGQAYSISASLSPYDDAANLLASADAIQWESLGRAPADGELVVSQSSPTIYLAQDANLWTTVDRGRHWEFETALYDALAAAGAER